MKVKKGDVLVLLGLCMLIEKHAVVPLHDGLFWSSLKDFKNSCNESLSKSDIHFLYLGRGNFAKLIPRLTPLHIVDETASSQTVVVGILFPLTQHENKTLDALIMSGLGVACGRDDTRNLHTPNLSSTQSVSCESTATIKHAPTQTKSTPKK